MTSTSSRSPDGALRPRPRTFRDPQLQARFEAEGVVVTPMLTRSEVRTLLRRYRTLMPSTPPGFASTQHQAGRTHKEAVDEALVELVERVDEVVDGFVPLASSFVTKGCDSASEMPLHQDWTFVDESHWHSLSVWCPLVDTDHRNGTLYVLRGGHTLPFTIRGTDIPSAFDDLEGDAYRHLSPVRLRAGEAVIYDQRVLHASPPNRARRPRVAAALVMVPAGATPLHFCAGPRPGTVERYEVGRDFFLDHTFGEQQMPDSAALAEQTEWTCPRFQEGDLAHLDPPEPLQLPSRRIWSRRATARR